MATEQPKKRATRRKTAKPAAPEVVETPVVVGQGRRERVLDNVAQLGLAVPSTTPTTEAAPAPRARSSKRRPSGAFEQTAFDFDE